MKKFEATVKSNSSNHSMKKIFWGENPQRVEELVRAEVSSVNYSVIDFKEVKV